MMPFFARHDITDQIETAESREPTDTKEPTANTEPNEPMDPIESADPIDPIERTEPFDATQRNESSEAIDHLDRLWLPSVTSSRRRWLARRRVPAPPARPRSDVRRNHRLSAA